LLRAATEFMLQRIDRHEAGGSPGH